jgi:uncharacterized membrane protein YgcG
MACGESVGPRPGIFARPDPFLRTDSHPDKGNEEAATLTGDGLNASSDAFVLAKMEAIVSGAQSATISEIRELLGDRGVDIADRKEALLNALRSIIAVDRRIADSRKKAIRIGEVLDAILLPDSVATMATALASAPADSQRALLTGLLQTAGVPPLDVPGLLAAALDEPAPGSETPAVPPIAPAKVAPSTPRSTGGGGRLHHSPTDPLEMAAAQEVAQRKHERQAASIRAHELEAVAAASRVAADALVAAQAETEAARVEFQIHNDPVLPVPLEMVNRLNTQGKSHLELLSMLDFAAKQIGFTAGQEGDFAAYKREIQRAIFSKDYPLPPGLLNFVLAATSFAEIRQGVFGSAAVVRRGGVVLQARDDQFVDVVISALLPDPKLAATLADIRALRESEPEDLIGQKVRTLFVDGSSTVTRADALQAKAELRDKVTNWALPGLTPLEAFADARRTAARVYALCATTAVTMDESLDKECERILFGLEIKGKSSPLYREQGTLLAAAAHTLKVMGVSAAERWPRLKKLAAEQPRLQQRLIASDSPSVVSTLAQPAMTQDVPPTAKAVPPPAKNVNGQGGGGGGGGGAKSALRVAFASPGGGGSGGGTGSEQTGAEPFCRFCKVKGHLTSACTKAVFVAGVGEGVVMEHWAQCWNCEAFGHRKLNCPKRTTSASASQLNGSALSSAGEGLGR